MTGHDQKVSETNFADIHRNYVDKIPVEFGHHDYQVKSTDQAKICTLEDLFKSVPKTQVI